MKLLKLEEPAMKIPKMNCDSIIDKKLQEYPAVECAFSQPNFTILTAKMGGGKTSLAINLIREVFKKCFHHIYTIIPEISLQSINPADNIFIKHLDEEHLYNNYDVETLEEIYDKLLDNSKEDEYSILLIDDFGSVFKKAKQEAIILNKIITKNRHLKCVVILLAQNISQLPKAWREIATNLITYNLGKSQMKRIFDEFFDYNESEFKEIMNLYKLPHDWLLLNLKYKRLFKGLGQEIVFEEE
jgi:DNA replication protein DnaC